MMATGAGLIVAPGLVATPLLGALGFSAGGIAAGSAAAGIQSGIGSVVAGSPFSILQSAGAGGAGLAVVNGVVQASGAVVGASGFAAKLMGQDDGNSANGDQEETDGGNDAEEKVVDALLPTRHLSLPCALNLRTIIFDSASPLLSPTSQQHNTTQYTTNQGVASLSPEDDNKPNGEGEGEGEVPQSRVERELMRFRRLKDDFFRSAPAVKEEPKAPRRRREFTQECRQFRSNGHCTRGASCDKFHFVPWELPGKEFGDHPVDLFFVNFRGFDHQRTMPFYDEFDRMCDHFGWSDAEATEPWHNFRIALIQEFTYVFGENERSLLNWQKMFKTIGLPEPTSLSEAYTVMRPIRVNLIDMLESSRTGKPVERFETLQGLSHYSYEEHKVFPRPPKSPRRKRKGSKPKTYSSGLLKMMLREISFKNQYLGTRLGGTEL
ncbi:hypothetical protein FCIRC_12126 [Fusarium circinatum]|uniref:C3H1-type domain-containing protein n=1 Tax=Fusarium circinatum TaxID=48490 RepID=A0A8H5T0H2_FUSCI|nr:hypothetical protein FCIRC_12126 [Fusarium circinatum]